MFGKKYMLRTKGRRLKELEMLKTLKLKIMMAGRRLEKEKREEVKIERKVVESLMFFRAAVEKGEKKWEKIVELEKEKERMIAEKEKWEREKTLRRVKLVEEKLRNIRLEREKKNKGI